jgi:hypothetical protein
MNILQSKSMRTARTGLAVLVVVGSAVAGTQIARGDANTTESRDLHRRQIAERSESERARLLRNFREFRQLPAAEQSRLRLLNDELKEDDRGQGGLRRIMGQYHDWLATLTVGQREDLRQQTDPNIREKRVRELLKQQQELAASTGSATGMKARWGLGSDDLEAVLGVVKKALLNRHELSDHEKARLESKVGLARQMYVTELGFRRPGIPPIQQVGCAPKVVDAMISAISNPRQRNLLQSKEKPMERAFVIFNMIRGGLLGEFDKIKPEPAALELFFVKLPSDKQDEIMRLPYDEQKKKLTLMYQEKQSEQDPDHYPRPPGPEFWMLRPAGFRAQAQPAGGLQQGADENQAQRENARKKSGKNAGRKNKAAGEPKADAEAAPEG